MSKIPPLAISQITVVPTSDRNVPATPNTLLLSRLTCKIALAVPAHPPQSRSSSPRGNVSGRENGYQQEGVRSTVSGIDPSLSPSPLGSHTPQSVATFFPDANNFSIGHQNIHVAHNVQQAAPSRTVFEFLKPYISHGAAYNSAERCDAPRCSPETREAIQEEVIGLIRDGDVYEPSKRMAWLGGPAGAGKTAIAGSVAATCAKLRLLAGTFFFSSIQGSGDTRHTKRYVITTLAYQLARHKTLHEYKAQLHVAIEENSDIFYKSLQEQAQCLILDPLRAIHGKCETSGWPRGILYDGLDEVMAVQYHDSTREDLIRKDEDDQTEILEVLHALARSPVFPFRIFIASRPEDNIAYFFSTTAQASSICLFLDSKYKPDADIKRFLQSKFAYLRHRSRISNPSWPSEKVIDQLVKMSSGQFIVPSTILRYIESGIPQTQLEDIMRVARGRMGAKNPFALLDAVYTHIINRSPDPRLAVIWIWRMITGMGPFDRKSSAHFWRIFFEDTDGQFYHLLKNLASLLSIPPNNDHHSPLETYHKSLIDFLASKDRCGDLYVERKSLDEFVARRYVVILQNRGPKVPLPSPDGVPRFLNQLLSSLPFNGSVESFGMAWNSTLFLEYLCKPSILELAACDVGWWTRFAITGLQWLLEGMYRYIHSTLCCVLRTGANDVCFPACIHWREGILAEARALGWCVHELEEVPLERLYQMRIREFSQKFRKLSRNEKCAVCQPSLDRQSE
ncbi:hypothetical protein NMY22_g14828 [Coprinellus aureogranulatus]|nr:hypothetical protein NMY22_g14828 [Coprinellus aureogranulatus]